MSRWTHLTIWNLIHCINLWHTMHKWRISKAQVNKMRLGVQSECHPHVCYKSSPEELCFELFIKQHICMQDGFSPTMPNLDGQVIWLFRLAIGECTKLQCFPAIDLFVATQHATYYIPFNMNKVIIHFGAVHNALIHSAPLLACSFAPSLSQTHRNGAVSLKKK